MSTPTSISLIERTEPLDGVWSYWRCSWEDEHGNEVFGEIQGDGHDYAIETLTDEEGNPIK